MKLDTLAENDLPLPAAAAKAGPRWVREAIAKCYFYSPMPVLTRPFRDRYQATLSPNGRLPRMSFERRKEPSARILIYHRVNDEKDPFFPAISTALFEAQMRFLRKHHTVVSLAELLKRLEGGSAEPALAITFDDGYQDNFHHALPILERHGLPASIFLTTGSIDSREPLWFEQLAQAVKSTPRKFIELGRELQEQVWLRTRAERLVALDRIFATFREMPDTERRDHLDRVLRYFATPNTTERNDQMLTWDQVRTMQTRGIDFGGHTVTHPLLSRMPADQVTWEVAECKRRIEEQLQVPVVHFAYPNGREKDFGTWNKELVRKAGYQAAVSTIWGVNFRSTDRMELRRGGPWESSAALFAYKLDWYQWVNN